MTDVSLLSSTPLIPVPVVEKAGKGQELPYLVAFAAVGLFFSVLSYALTPPGWWPEGTVALVPETASLGLTVSQIDTPVGLLIAAEHPTH
jgi:hypothetical protein